MTWIGNCAHYKVWNEITNPFANFNVCTILKQSCSVEWINRQMKNFDTLRLGYIYASVYCTSIGSVTRSFDIFFDLDPNKRLSKHSGVWWFEMPMNTCRFYLVLYSGGLDLYISVVLPHVCTYEWLFLIISPCQNIYSLVFHSHDKGNVMNTI